MEKIQNLLLDFSHTYPEGVEKQAKNLKRIDMSDISGTDMYCSREAEQEDQEPSETIWPARGFTSLIMGIITM